MRIELILLAIMAATVLMAKSEGVPEQQVVVRTSNADVEVVGFDGEQIVVNTSAHATVKNLDGRWLVEAEGPADGSPLILQVPRGSSLDVLTSNGGIRVSGVAGWLRLTASNGPVSVLDGGALGLRVHTSNAPIEVHLARAVNADLAARTSNGEIHSEVSILRKHRGTNFLEGMLGEGGPAIDLQTSNGPIVLKNAGEREHVSSNFKPGDLK